jgi:ceramide glucosyltransferase
MTVAVFKAVSAGLVVTYLAYLVLAHVLTWRYFSRYDRVHRLKGHTPPVSIIKPVKGLDPGASENYRSFCDQDYPNDFEVLFCVDGREDPAVPVIEALIDEYPDARVRLLVVPPEERSFGKMKKMIAGIAESRHEIVVVGNADVRVAPSFLREAVGRFDDPKIGLAMSAAAYEGAENCAAACWNISTAALVVRLASACAFDLLDVVDAKNLVIRKQTIAEIGGLEQFGRQADDVMTLAREVRKRGYHLHLLKQPARIFHPDDSWIGWWSHWHRWLVVTRHYLPGPIWPLSLTQVPIWWSLFYLLLAILGHDGVGTGLLLVGTVITADLLSAAIINLKFVRDPKMWRFIWVMPILQLSSLPLLVGSCLTNEIVWRQTRLRVNDDCTLSEVGAFQ